MRFAVTFDVPGGSLYFEKTASSGKPEVWDRAGIWIERGDKGFEVVHVVEGGPAASRAVRPGDVIVAIDGKPWTGSTLSALR
jgi:C-terminal processing protease CtpA/Prc